MAHVSIFLDQDSICDKNNAPSVSSISRVLRGGHTDLSGSADEGRTNHSIDGILGKKMRLHDNVFIIFSPFFFRAT